MGWHRFKHNGSRWHVSSAGIVRDLHVSTYIRGCIFSCLPGSSADGSLTDQMQTLASCAKGVMKDVLNRLDALEKEVFSCLRKATTLERLFWPLPSRHLNSTAPPAGMRVSTEVSVG